jgi:AcrR family transcriptional regulator
MPRPVRRAPDIRAAEHSEPSSTRDRILAAAMRLVETDGLQALSQGRAAVAAGLRQSHVTYYFPTRSDLIAALAEMIHAQMLQTMNAPAVPGGSRRMIKGLREFFVTRAYDRLFARLMLSLVAAADEDSSVRSWLTNFENEVRMRLREVFSNLDLNPSDDELGLFHVSLIGSSILALHGSEKTADRAAQLVGLAFDRLTRASIPRNRSRPPPVRRTRSLG